MIRSLRLDLSILLLLTILSAQGANASIWPDFDNWNLNVFGGLGGTGIQKQVEKNDEILDVSRGESPGVIGFDFETFTSDRWRFTIGHRRGFRLGPFSSGVGFTGLSWNWYFLSTPPTAVNFGSENYLAEDSSSMFVGVSTGVAYGTITREADEVGSVTASGAYIGIRFGMDYSWSPGVIIRPEVFGSQTFYDTGNLASSLNDFGIVCGLVFRLPEVFGK